MADMDKQVIEVERSKEIDLNSLEFLSVKNTAKLLGVSNKMVYTLIKTGQIQASNLSSRKIIISRLAIDNLLALKEIEVEPRITKELEVSLKDCYYMAEAQEKYNISEGALYRIIKRNDIGKHKSGKYTYVKKTALENVFNPIELCQK